MIIRKLKKNEKYKSYLVSSVAFQYGINYTELKNAALSMTEEEISEDEKIKPAEEPFLLSDNYKTETWAALDDDNSTVMASMEVIPYTVRFDGNDILMGGIGGVATIPTCRRQGCIRNCFSAVFKDLNDKGFVLSHLYPFSHAYYRKFGYETGVRFNNYDINFNAIKKYDSDGYAEFLNPESDLSVLDEIYNKFYKDYNLSGVKKSYSKNYIQANLLGECHYIYIWRNSKKQATGFMIFRENDGFIDCNSNFGYKNGFLFLDTDALLGLLNFAMTAFVPRYKSIRLQLPFEMRPDLLLNEANDIKCSIYFNGMTRVINAEKTLNLCSCLGNGEVNISIIDDMAPWNNGVWKLKFGSGGNNIVTKTEDIPDIEMDIAAFTTLICGYSGYDDIIFMQNVKIKNKNAPIRNVFYNKKAITTDSF